MKKIWKNVCLLLGALLFSLSLSGCGDEYKWTLVNGSASVIEGRFPMSYILYAKNQETGQLAVNRMLQTIQEFSAFVSVDVEDSQVNEINRLDAEVEFEVHFWIYDMLMLSKEYKELSDGAFDPAVYPLLELWSLRAPHTTWNYPPEEIPTIEQITATLEYCNLDLIDVYEAEGKYFVKKSDARVMIELGSISKGYLVDILRDICLELDIRSGMINISGNVYLINGKGELDEGWTVGLEPPRRKAYFSDEYFAVFLAKNTSSVASGDYNFYYPYFYEDESEPIRVPHIINPKTGMPLNIQYDEQSGRFIQASDGVVNTHIMGESSAICDILTTITILMDFEEGHDFLKASEGYMGMLITEDMKYTIVGDYDFFIPDSETLVLHYNEYEYVDFS